MDLEEDIQLGELVSLLQTCLKENKILSEILLDPLDTSLLDRLMAEGSDDDDED